MLELRNIHKYYNPGTVNEMCLFEDFNLTINQGEFVSVVGSNGSGKTSMLNIICGSIPVESGQILIDGKDITKIKEYKRNQKIGRVYQNPSMGTCPSMTILENMSLADNKGRFYGLGRGTNKARIDYYREQLAQLGLGLEDKLHVKVGSLSGGQRQRVGIAQALLGTPEFLILDEPTVGLDPEERIRFRNFFSQTAQDKLVLLSTHIIEDVQSVCDRLIVIDRGQILFIGRPEELVLQARGHVGVFLEQGGGEKTSALRIISRVNTAEGVLCRGVAEVLPQEARSVEPTLEDAYLYLITQEGKTQ